MTRLPSRSVQTAVASAGAWSRSLPVELRDWLMAHAEVRTLAAGQRLFARGDAPDGLYCVTRGAIRISGIAATGEEAVLVMLEAPNWFGEIALFDNEPRTHDAWAASDATLLRVGEAALQRRLAERPADWCHFGRLLTQKLRLVFATVEDMALMRPTARVARRLATMASGYGAWTDRTSRRLQISQEQLASMLSLSRQTVNQSLKELETAGTLRLGRGTIDILDIDRLAEPGRREGRGVD